MGKMNTFERRETILKLRNDGRTLDQIGQQFGLTRERVRQIISNELPRVLNKIDPLVGIVHCSTDWVITNNVIQRFPTCQGCGIECKTNAHHPNYTNPFRIIWLCNSCHKKIHGKGLENREIDQREKNGNLQMGCKT